MFFLIQVEGDVKLHPRDFGNNIHVVAKLMNDVEGSCCADHGCNIVAVTGIESIGEGLFGDGTGFASFRVECRLLVFRPFKGEILQAVVTLVNRFRFIAEAGPVRIIVPSPWMPVNMKFQPGHMPSFTRTTSDGRVVILQKDSEVRLKIVGIRVTDTEIFCTGTIKDEFLGVISDPDATS